MRNYIMTHYQSFGPGFDSMTRDIEAVLQVYTGITTAFAALIVVVVVCLIICEMREREATRPAPRARRFGSRELTDTGF